MRTARRAIDHAVVRVVCGQRRGVEAVVRDLTALEERDDFLARRLAFIGLGSGGDTRFFARLNLPLFLVQLSS